MRILYIHRGLVLPPDDERLDVFAALSRRIEGDVLHPVWWTTAEEARKGLGRRSYPTHEVGRFRYHLFLAGLACGLRQRIRTLWFYVRTGRRIHRERPFDCIVTYSYMLTGLAGIILKWCTGAKLIMEIPCEPGRAYLFDRPRPSMTGRFLAFASIVALHLAAWSADRLSLLSPQQLRAFPLLRCVPVSVIHAFVPVSLIQRAEATERYILHVGYPGYLKGADTMVEAFRRIAAQFPDVKLRLLGFYPDPAERERLIGGCAQIEIHKPLPYSQGLSVIAKALIVAHPTRTEGMGRVLIEAMASGRPCVASAVGGIPHYIREGHNGVLVQPGDAAGLADKLRLLLSDTELRERIGANGFEHAHGGLSEQMFVSQFEEMLSQTVRQ